MSASIFSPGDITDISTVNADNTRKSQRFATPTAGQVTFNITNFAYAVGTGSLGITINGVQQYPGVDFTEVSPTVFRLTEPVELGDVVDAYGLVGSPATASAASSAQAAAAYAQTAQDAIISTGQNALTAINAAGAASNSAALAGTKAQASSDSAAAAQLAAQQAANSAGGATNSQVQSDLAVTDTNLKSYILNRSALLTTLIMAGLNTALTGTVSAADSLIAAVGKIQKQLNDHTALKADKATTLGGYGITDAVKVNVANSSNGTALKSGAQPNIASISSTGNDNTGPLVISNDSNNAAAACIYFLRAGVWGAHFGLDTDNKLKIGGSTFGNNAYDIYHAGNPPNQYLNRAGGDITGPVTLAQNLGIYWRDASNNSRPVLYTDTGGFTNFISMGSSLRFFNANQTRVPWQTTAAGTVNQEGVLNVDCSYTNPGNTMNLTNGNGSGVQMGWYSAGGAKTLRLIGNAFDIVNSAYSQVILSLSDAGVLQAIAVQQTSDERKKKNWTKYPKDIIERFAAIKKVGGFQWKGSNEWSDSIGAQSLAKLFPNSVTPQRDGTLGINAGGVSMVMVHALCERMLELEAEIKSLKGNTNGN